MDFFESDNFNAAEIAEENEHLRLVLAQMREQIELLKNDGFAYRTINFYDDNEVEEYRTEKFRHDERLHDIKILEASLSTPYFARMRLEQIGSVQRDDRRSMTRARVIELDETPLGEESDIYVGAHVVFFRGKIITVSYTQGTLPTTCRG